MTSLDERRAVIARGNNAKALLESPAFEATYDDLLEGLFSKFLATESHQGEERDNIWDLTAALKLFKAKLEADVSSARVEEANKKADER